MSTSYEILKEEYKKRDISRRSLDVVLELFDVFKKEMGYDTEGYWKFSETGITAIENKSATYTYHKGENLLVEFTVNTIDKAAIDSFVKELKTKEIDWGIITTGNQYLLFNGKVCAGDGWKWNPILLEVTMQGGHGKEYMDFLSCSNIFVEKKAKFLCDVINYKNQFFRGNENSWKAYESSCRRYVKYLAFQIHNYQDKIYENLSLKDFINFIQRIKEEEGRAITSPNAIKNIYRHISNFMHCMAADNKEFYKGAQEVVAAFSDLKEKEIGNIFDEKHLKNVVDYIKSQKQGERNLLLFYLCLCFGMERSQLCNLKWGDIEDGFIKVDGRLKRMPNRLCTMFKRLDEENKKRNISSEYIFYTIKGGKQTPLKEWAVNEMFSDLSKIDGSDKLYSQYVPANIRKVLAEYLLLERKAGLSEVMDLLGISVANLGRYVSDEVVQKVADREKGENHLLESLINQIDEG